MWSIIFTGDKSTNAYVIIAKYIISKESRDKFSNRSMSALSRKSIYIYIYTYTLISKEYTEMKLGFNLFWVSNIKKIPISILWFTYGIAWQVAWLLWQYHKHTNVPAVSNDPCARHHWYISEDRSTLPEACRCYRSTGVRQIWWSPLLDSIQRR